MNSLQLSLRFKKKIRHLKTVLTQIRWESVKNFLIGVKMKGLRKKICH